MTNHLSTVLLKSAWLQTSYRNVLRAHYKDKQR